MRYRVLHKPNLVAYVAKEFATEAEAKTYVRQMETMFNKTEWSVEVVA